MKKTTIKIKNYVGRVNVVDNGNLNVKLFRIALFSIGMFAFLYALIIGSMIFNVAERQLLSKQSKVLSSEVGELELKYLSMSGEIDKTFSMRMGFEEARPQFATRKSLTALRITANEL